ncbi:uncharacterized protein LOC143043123 [Mytilus galloprovincialis]|uniref:uncharacterized protein LOC143043123 n=1 Tax=Mytilus galloprovincialis TaxID=29158 RepID=UPI003F7C3738
MDAGQIMFYVVLFYLPSIQCVKLGVCSKEKSVMVSGQTVIRTLYFCCRHYEESSGICEECDTGYESNGTRCEPCKTGQFGIKCADTCHCKTHESCDHIRGCIQSTNQLITGEHITPITEKTAKDSENEGFLNKESGVYFGSFGLLAFVICILMAYICYKKGKRKAGANVPKQNTNELAMDIKCLVHGTKGEMITNENDYDEIDERYLSDVKLAVNQEKDFKKKEKVQPGGSKHSKKEKNNSSSNPYQLVVSSAVDVHEYSSPEKGDNSEDNYRDSGYLHPYQPLSLDAKILKHDYTECKDLDIVESKATIDNTDLKHDYTECEDLQSVEALTRNTKEDDADKEFEAVKEEDTSLSV